MIQLFRGALYPTYQLKSGEVDMSLEAFINRYPDCHRFHVTWKTQHQFNQRQQKSNDHWEKELEAMKKRNTDPHGDILQLASPTRKPTPKMSPNRSSSLPLNSAQPQSVNTPQTLLPRSVSFKWTKKKRSLITSSHTSINPKMPFR